MKSELLVDDVAKILTRNREMNIKPYSFDWSYEHFMNHKSMKMVKKLIV